MTGLLLRLFYAPNWRSEMIYIQIWRILRSTCCVVFALVSLTRFASAEVLVFNQISASVPGLFISAVIDVNGGLDLLPTINNFRSPPTGGYDFGNLDALDIFLPVNPPQKSRFTLEDFTERRQPGGTGVFDFPQWSISPNQIRFNNTETDFLIILDNILSTIRFNTDAPSTPRECMMTGRCVVQGQWQVTSVPVPASVHLFLGALVAGTLVFRRRGARVAGSGTSAAA